ncbi:leukemia inhibitory factor receptor-like [Melanotaenia boesemani]|uniref:leukemia inhibitory factor receptor-like n=1 Tax=Melanotaenia boesemani TaxID=1250792 RepID=UPI001C046B77|nr:leukemia inhibitory factor receptor-like [Melanotaenia boesemani]
MMMITWLLLPLLLCESKEDGHGQEKDVLNCRHQNRTLTVSGQMFLLTWEDDPSCSALKDSLIYELRVLIADKQVHYDEVVVASDQIGSTHSWNWTSHLALKHTEHSVRLTPRYNSHASLCNFPGRPGKTEVYPQNRFFEVGSTATFCCLTAAGQSFKQMHFSGYNTSSMITEIRNQTYALSVHFHQTKARYVDVECRTDVTLAGACTYIGRPPNDRDLWCETWDLESVECHWTVGSDVSALNPTTYELLGSTCQHGNEGRCSVKKLVEAGEETWILTAQNKLGKLLLHDRGDLTKRVRMLAPDGVSASRVSARDAVLGWSWTVHKYRSLNVTCQVNVSHGVTSTITEDSGVGLNASVLANLIPNWTYNVQVRCATAGFWKWGDWSNSTDFHTKGDVPDAPDVWMHMEENDTVIMWKTLLANQSQGDIIQYEVTWSHRSMRGQPNQVNVTHSKHNLTLTLDPREEHVVIVTARNKHGNSSPSTIVIPSNRSDKTSVKTRITGQEGGFDLSWPYSPAASCGYVVAWYPDVKLGPVEWLKLPPNQTSTRIKNFRDGWRYSLSIYACTQAAPELLAIMEGYTREIGIEKELFKLNYEQQDSGVEISWDPVPLRQQSAFIQGYVLRCWSEDKEVFNVSTDNPAATSLRAAILKPNTYLFMVAAQTAVGEGGNTTISIHVDTWVDKLIKSVFISLGAVFSLLFFFTILCHRYWACIKQKIYPPLPKPVLTDKWMTSPVVHGYPALLSHHSEESLDIPELLYKREEDVSGDAVQEHLSSPVDYYNKHHEQYIPPPLNVPNPSIPHPSPSSFTFPNPSYNLLIKGRDQAEPDVQKGTPSVTVSSEYQPQSFMATSLTHAEEPTEAMPCDPTYILLPQLPNP